jgi:DNA-3-methyladenine glycosylase
MGQSSSCYSTDTAPSDVLAFLNGPANEVAPQLLGCIFERTLRNGTILRGKIVETEAYDQTDTASHSYKGKTPRTEIMFGPSGHLYVYFTYGMHYCCNVVTGPLNNGAAVLIRALEPLLGQADMELRRSHHGRELTNGPAKLCQLLAIDSSLNGQDLHTPPLRLVVPVRRDEVDIVQTTRVGVSTAKEVPWRFYYRNNPYVPGMRR